MIEIAAILALATVPQLAPKKQEDQYVIISNSQPVPTVISGDKVTSKFYGTATTYQTESPVDDVFISPVKRSISVTSPVLVGGRVAPLPIDDEDNIVYFDEWE